MLTHSQRVWGVTNSTDSFTSLFVTDISDLALSICISPHTYTRLPKVKSMGRTTHKQLTYGIPLNVRIYSRNDSLNTHTERYSHTTRTFNDYR